MSSDCNYTPKHKKRHIHTNRHMRELKCPRNTHEHKGKHKHYMYSQQKTHTQGRNVTDVHEWFRWTQWGNGIEGDTISGYGSAHMGTDDPYFARMARGRTARTKTTPPNLGGEKGKKKTKRTQRAHTSPRHCICNAKHNGSRAKRVTEK